MYKYYVLLETTNARIKMYGTYYTYKSVNCRYFYINTLGQFVTRYVGNSYSGGIYLTLSFYELTTAI